MPQYGAHDLKFQKRTARLKYRPNNWKRLSRTDRYETKNLVEASFALIKSWVIRLPFVVQL